MRRLSLRRTADGSRIIMCTAGIRHAVVELSDEVGAANAFQLALNAAPLLGFIPEEEHALLELFSRRVGAEYGLKRIRVITRVKSCCTDSHRRRREVLHLFEVEVQVLCDDGQLSHILLVTSRVAADEVGNELLVEVSLFVDFIKQPLEIVE